MEERVTLLHVYLSWLTDVARVLESHPPFQPHQPNADGEGDSSNSSNSSKIRVIEVTQVPTQRAEKI